MIRMRKENIAKVTGSYIFTSVAQLEDKITVLAQGIHIISPV
uniref:Uncharacterized protein n=2 Tax=Anguilla anguilla TaxID=7936 RepID=A0A0E9SV73_ANGAN